MRRQKVQRLLISDPTGILYLTGILLNPMERLCVLAVPQTGECVLHLDKIMEIPQSGITAVRSNQLAQGVAQLAAQIPNGTALCVDDGFPARVLVPLLNLCKGGSVCLAEGCLDAVRACKDPWEQQRMREAAQVADTVMEQAIGFLREGITERQVSDFICRCFREKGCHCSNVFIVAFGANAGDPHHVASETAVLHPGDCVMMDIGCEKAQYWSDLTRTVYYKNVDAAQQHLYNTVLRANCAAEALVRPGVPLRALDAAARSIIEKEGLGAGFTHRLGHFIGLAGHENGSVSEESNQLAREGMIFSIEPGVYLPGKYGARIEDLVLVTTQGFERLNTIDKTMRIVQ